MIKFEHVYKSFDAETVLEDINLEINEGEIYVLLGASGCGKTTCLKMINRLETPTSGKILLKGNNITDAEVIPYRRNIGYVLQNTGLFPHMTVRENLSLLQEIEKIPPKRIAQVNCELMQMIGMDDEQYMDRYPYQLSGGQKQRVGVARAFALNPDIILMDEPFSAVDPLVRLSLQDQLLEIQKKRKKTIVFVTHDIGEALRIGSKVCLFHDKKIVQCGTPDELITKPANEYVRNFIGKAVTNHSSRYCKIEQVYRDDIILANPEESIVTVKKRLEDQKASKVVIVNEENMPIGMASEQRIAHNAVTEAALKDIMWTHFEAVSFLEEINDAIRIMNQYGVSYLPVVNEQKKVVGVVNAVDILKFVTED